MDTAPLTLLYCPFPDAHTARMAATALLEARLVACCNLLNASTSLYWWQGTLTESEEVLLLCKTSPALAPSAMERLAMLHPYECPAILRFSADAPVPFTDWIRAETTNAMKS